MSEWPAMLKEEMVCMPMGKVPSWHNMKASVPVTCSFFSPGMVEGMFFHHA